MNYQQFLAAKAKVATLQGITVDPADVNPILKPHHRAIVIWALRGGRRAIFAAFGLGKSVIQLEIMRLILPHAGGRALIVLPLGVRQEFVRDAELLRTGNHPRITDAERAVLRAWLAGRPDREIHPRFIRTIEEAGETGLYTTNYETVRDGKLDPNHFTAASLDEADVLRSFGSKTYQTFLTLFDRVRFRFVASATPSPNRYKELIHYGGFLGVMDTGQALTRWFQRNSEKAGDLTLYPHKEKEFYLWLNSWACFIQKPSDLGYSDDGYELPPMIVRWHEVKVDLSATEMERDGQYRLIRDTAISVQTAAKEKRDTLPARIAQMQEILRADPGAHRILWHDLEAERVAIEAAVPAAISVYGSQDLDEREQAIIDFSDGKFPLLAAKPVIAGAGCNFQRHCHKALFLGIGFKFRDFIQAIHRIQRFLQTSPVEIDIIYAESEREVRRDLEAKWARHIELVKTMSEIIKKYGLNADLMADEMRRSIGVERIEVTGDRYLIANNDCVDETRRMETDSIDLLVTSIPFANHYEYTPSYNDFGHTDTNDHFWSQMDFLTPELLRVMAPGRLACIHVKDRILFGAQHGTGAPTVSPFHAEAIFHYRRHGFDFMGMITVTTDVVRENNQTNRLGYTEMLKDGTKMGIGCPEYVLLFRKPQSDRSKSYADVKVVKDREDYSLARWQVDAHAFWRSAGDRLITPDEMAALGPSKLASYFPRRSLETLYDYDFHVQIGERLLAEGKLPSSFMALAPGSADPAVWHDVTRMRTLNSEQYRRAVEKHVCPLQFDIVDRLITRFSNRGELVFDPFGGLMTVPYRAILMGRRGRGVELNPQYFADGAHYCATAEREAAIPTLFDLMQKPAPSAAAE